MAALGWKLGDGFPVGYTVEMAARLGREGGVAWFQIPAAAWLRCCWLVLLAR